MIVDPASFGWTHQPFEGFMAHVGGLWQREDEEGPEFGFLAGAIHANRNGVVHGGMLMTFVDRAFGQTARRVSGAVRAATISLNTQFLASMPVDTFATVRPQVRRLTGHLVFLDGVVTTREGEPLVSAQGVWRFSLRP